MNKNKNIMASYDPMTATNHNMLEDMEESTYEMTKSHAKRVHNLYSKIRNIKINRGVTETYTIREFGEF